MLECTGKTKDGNWGPGSETICTKGTAFHPHNTDPGVGLLVYKRVRCVPIPGCVSQCFTLKTGLCLNLNKKYENGTDTLQGGFKTSYGFKTFNHEFRKMWPPPPAKNSKLLPRGNPMNREQSVNTMDELQKFTLRARKVLENIETGKMKMSQVSCTKLDLKLSQTAIANW